MALYIPLYHYVNLTKFRANQYVGNDLNLVDTERPWHHDFQFNADNAEQFIQVANEHTFKAWCAHLWIKGGYQHKVLNSLGWVQHQQEICDWYCSLDLPGKDWEKFNADVLKWYDKVRHERTLVIAKEEAAVKVIKDYGGSIQALKGAETRLERALEAIV